MNSNFDPTRDPVSNSPYGGTNRKIPGLIEGEHYDEGGQGISYNDDDKREGDPTFRAGDNVDVITGGSNGYSVGFTITGEWLEYTVDVTTGIYNIVFYYSSGPSPIGNLKVNLDGTELANISGMEPWKGWAEAATVTVKDIAISGGTDKILKLEIVDGRKFNIDAIEFSNPVTGVSISGCPADSLLAGASHQLTANLSPSDATDQSVSWSSSNTSVATVDASGLVSAVSAGSSTITVTTNDDSFTDNCEVYSTISTDIETRLELNNKWIKLYPNPLNNGLLNVSTSENINQLQIFDLHGKMVHREQNLGTNVTLDLSKLNEGLYMFHIISKQSKAVRKVLIQ